jgi:enediyne biosynthesis protein E4
MGFVARVFQLVLHSAAASLILPEMQGRSTNFTQHGFRFSHAILVCLLLAVSGVIAAAPLGDSANGFPSVPLSFEHTDPAGFSALPVSRTGIAFSNRLSDQKAAENQIRLNGSGVALGDFDGDGWCDVFLCGLEGGNALYRNLGDWRFAEVDIRSGPACPDQFSTGAVFSDLDGDADLDLLITGIGVGTRLFVNDGQGGFVENHEAGLIGKLGAGTMTLADIDQDGDLDLYVANYRTTTIRTTGFAVLSVGGKRMIRPQDRNRLEYTSEGRVLEHGEPDILYRNDGSGRFTPDPWVRGTFLDEDNNRLTRPPLDWGLSAMFRDINGDGSPDLYVCNDFHSTDKIWINQGDGRFRLISKLALRNTSTFSMAVDFGDINRDGWDDILVADMLSLRHSRRLMQFGASESYRSSVGVFEDRPQYDRNTLHLNRGDGTFAEVAAYSGLTASEWTWSVVFLDVDLDGYEDLLCATGHLFDTQDLDAEARIRSKGPWPTDQIPQKLLMFPKMRQPNVAFRNRGDMTFTDVSSEWGFNEEGVSHGMALGDLDNDGDLDVVVNNLNQNAGVYRNNCPGSRIAVRLKGEGGNRFGIGARIRVFGDGVVDQSQEVISGGRYLSGDQALRTFSAGSGTTNLAIQVRWPGGRISTVKGANANRLYEISVLTSRPDSSLASGTRSGDASTKPPPRLFDDVSVRIGSSHADLEFDDFARQPLLPRKLSQLGPGVAWFDVNQDGWDDLVVGAGRGGAMAIHLADGQGGFNGTAEGATEQPVTRDLTTGIGWWKTAETVELLFGSANYEDGLAVGGSVRQFDLRSRQWEDVAPAQAGSTGPIAMADVDGDGDLDLFVGGRCVPGRWPEAATSMLLRNQGGHFEADAALAEPFLSIGLVSGAVFSDLNGDGQPDLALACDWGAVRVFMNNQGRFVDATAGFGLDPYRGIWNGIQAGDFDGDGRMDLVVSNWGWNSGYQTPREPAAARALLSRQISETGADIDSPILYYGDFDGNGSVDILEAIVVPGIPKPVPVRSFNSVSLGLPEVQERFRSFADFNRADVFQIAGADLRENAALRLTWLASTVFLNRGDRFDPVALPPEAQLAPAFGVCVADFDGDGSEDVFLNQNFFPVQPNASRLDAGRGLLLRGDGEGRFTAVKAATSGLQIYGEGRGAAVTDFDHDGRADLAVAQNGASTQLYRNIGGHPGLRVRLRGTPLNPTAVGAAVRWISEARKGPVREIHSGAGYWSQDGATVVLPVPADAQKIWVRWPGGRETTHEIPHEDREITLTQPGGR